MEKGFLNPGKARVGCLHCSLGIHCQEEVFKGSFGDAMPRMPVILRASHWPGWSVRLCLTGHTLEGPFERVDEE